MEDDGYEVDIKKSAKFNAGILQTQRINKILDLLNFSKSNPLAFNTDYNEWNFILGFRSVNSLYDEIDSYLKNTEVIICLKMRDKVIELMEKYPVVEENKNSVSRQIEKRFNLNNWKYINKAIEHYERVVKRLGLKYQVISATVEEDDGL